MSKSTSEVIGRRLTVRAGKTGRPRVVPIPAPLSGVLGRASREGKYVVPREVQWDTEARKVVKRLRAECGSVPDGRVRWNAWRHTFGSLLAQEGVSLDKISAWMGNTPEVCRRHYAQFVPRDHHDEDIERL